MWILKTENSNLKPTTAFLSFKSEEEARCNTQYIQKCGRQMSMDGNSERWYFYCSRSGNYVPKSIGKRQSKLQGTSKIGSQCTAHMKVHHNKVTDKVDVEYCNYHHNHSTMIIAHTRWIPDETRHAIAAQLQNGVSIDKIMDNIRNKVHSTIKREQLVTRMDVQNIKRQYNIECIEKAKNDLLSVQAWVDQLESLEYNPITIFKVQGEQQSEQTNNLASNYFLLGIQTKFQRDALVKFCKNGVCMDTTHATNQYDFLYLHTLLVLMGWVWWGYTSGGWYPIERMEQ